MTNERDRSARQWVDEVEEAINRTVSAVRTAWEGTPVSRMSVRETAKDAIGRLGEAIDPGMELARESWDQSASHSGNPDDDVVVDVGA